MNISAANTNLVSNNAPCAKNVPAGNVPAENNSAALDTLELSSEEKDDINTLVSLKGGKLEDYTLVAGTKGDDEINVTNGKNGGLDVTVKRFIGQRSSGESVHPPEKIRENTQHEYAGIFL